MTIIVVSDYVDSKKWRVDLDSWAVSPAPKDAAVYGLGQWRTLGLLRDRRRTFVAVFLRNEEIFLRVAEKEFNLADPHIRAESRGLLPFVVRNFSLKTDMHLLLDVRYWFLQTQGWPDDGDIFSVVRRMLTSPEGARGFVYVWKAISEGRDVGSKAFLEELQARIDSSSADRTTGS